MLSTMQNSQLTIRSILEHGTRLYPNSKVYTYLGGETSSHSFKEIGERAAQLAHALLSLGVRDSDRVATFCFNHNQHLEAYYAVAGSKEQNILTGEVLKLDSKLIKRLVSDIPLPTKLPEAKWL